MNCLEKKRKKLVKLDTNDFGVVTYQELATMLGFGKNTIARWVRQFGVEEAIARANKLRESKKTVIYFGDKVLLSDAARETGLSISTITKVAESGLDLSEYINNLNKKEDSIEPGKTVVEMRLSRSARKTNLKTKRYNENTLAQCTNRYNAK